MVHDCLVKQVSLLAEKLKPPRESRVYNWQCDEEDWHKSGVTCATNAFVGAWKAVGEVTSVQLVSTTSANEEDERQESKSGRI